MSLLSIVVPCFNEEETVSLFYDAVEKVLKTMDISDEIIFVNDGSKDNTLAEMIKLYQFHPKELKFIDFIRNFGK